MTALVGARLFDGERFLDDHAVIVEGAAHRRRRALCASVPRGGGEVDLGGGILAPGFVDVQVNGGGGALFNDGPSADVVARIAESHRKYGTVGMMPTLVTDTPEKMRAAIAAVRDARRRFPRCSASISRGRSSTRRGRARTTPTTFARSSRATSK